MDSPAMDLNKYLIKAWIRPTDEESKSARWILKQTPNKQTQEDLRSLYGRIKDTNCV